MTGKNRGTNTVWSNIWVSKESEKQIKVHMAQCNHCFVNKDRECLYFFTIATLMLLNPADKYWSLQNFEKVTRT